MDDLVFLISQHIKVNLYTHTVLEKNKISIDIHKKKIEI